MQKSRGAGLARICEMDGDLAWGHWSLPTFLLLLASLLCASESPVLHQTLCVPGRSDTVPCPEALVCASASRGAPCSVWVSRWSSRELDSDSWVVLNQVLFWCEGRAACLNPAQNLWTLKISLINIKSWRILQMAKMDFNLYMDMDIWKHFNW